MQEILQVIYERLGDDYQVYQDLYDMCRDCWESDKALAVSYLKKLSAAIEAKMGKTNDDALVMRLYELHRRVLLKAAVDDFESYLLYVEWNREPDKKFYPPRRKILKRVVDALQELADGKLDLLAISMPPGTGKTTLAIFYLTWLAGKYPNEPMLTGSHSNSFVRGVYDECLRILDAAGDYLWHDVLSLIHI